MAEGDGELLGLSASPRRVGFTFCAACKFHLRRSDRESERLLHEFMKRLGGAKCYCVPYTHLDGFYAQAGFRECSSESAPRFLADRLSQYLGRSQGNSHAPS